MPSTENLLTAIQKVWKDKVSMDAKEARLWNNEEAVAASIYHHLRNDYLDKHHQLRVWLNPSIPVTSKKMIRPDLVIIRLPENYVNKRKTYEKVAHERLLVAVELKSRSQITSYSKITEDYERLQTLRKEYPGIGTMFGILDDSISSTNRYEFVKERCQEFKIPTLYGSDYLGMWECIWS